MSLVDELEKDMLDLYERTRDPKTGLRGYNPTDYKILILQRKAVDAARYMLSGNPPEGFSKLLLAGRADLSLERLIVDNRKYWDLIGDEYVITAHKRLGLKPPA